MARLTDSIIKSIMPLAPRKAREASIPILERVAFHYNITTAPRMRMWLSTLAAESGELKYQEELASGAAYEGRTDLGNTQAGDGRRFKGHGRIQLTGRDVHAKYTAYLKKSGHLPFVDFVANPKRLAEEPYATDSAGWFVNGYKNLNPLADAGNFLAYQVKVNGRNKSGKPNHWAERSEYYRRAIMAIPSDWVLEIPSAISEAPLELSSQHRDVLEGTAGWPDFETVPMDEKDISETPNGADEASLAAPEEQSIGQGGADQKNGSEAAGLAGNAMPAASSEPVKDETPQVIAKERPSLFNRVFTAILGAIATAIAGITTTCGGNEVANIVATKGAERVVEGADRQDLYTLGFVLLYVLIGLGAATAMLAIASWFNGKSSDNAKEVNLAKIEAAKSKEANTVEFQENIQPKK